jgi:xanthine phosphoribosyltransferase
MKLLEKKIEELGQIIGSDILKVDMFLNHQIDVNLLDEMGKEFYRLFKDKGINKILTVESSGIAIAVMAAKYFDVPVVFAKKSSHKNVGNDCFMAKSHSFTHGKDYEMIVSKKYLSPADNILFIDDFLAGGNAAFAVLDILKQSGANLVGIGIAIEKGFQDGGKKLREMGIELQSLAIVEEMSETNGINFRKC